ncbi:aconitate hydratase [Zhengella mangrovi]|uniref:Aconitate hydratase A n=1 Tax=Zhengella mangrovi TaxID=1982044 RepID=A0A2G1QK21_9HYPH|nr:aconitate hydratase AcnA [Zhengella mangrovi]PHP65811.1 aconitate hydratase [Zhengella mangrovi]
MAQGPIWTNSSVGSCIDVRAFAGARLDLLPYSFRVLLACALADGRQDDARAILDWLEARRSDAEVAFVPRRLLMHDTTAMPALVDLATLRDVVAEAGGDPSRVNPICPVAVSVDHSLSVVRHATPEAMAYNTTREVELNAERYSFLKWADRAFGSLEVFPPGYGILHTINLEHLASVADGVEGPDGSVRIVPDTMIGTDSHTPMINAIGVLGWGVGGLEAESAMLGEAMPLALPDVVGVRLSGRLRHGVLATDLALHVTQRLRQLGVVGQFVEFFGPGLDGLSVGERAAVANMAPEYGATVGFFPVDDAVLRYLEATGRPSRHVDRVGFYARTIGLWRNPDDRPAYSRAIEIDLDAIDPSAAGPRRPQDRHPLHAIALDPVETQAGAVPDGAVAIAAITSCTNTADLGMLVTAALVARAAKRAGLTVPAWVKTSFAPGSRAMLNALERAGLLADLEAAGFNAVGIGCTTCIGNSGPLAPAMDGALAGRPEMARVAVLSGNRNFPGRIHPAVMDAYLVSPPLVVAYAFAGRLGDIEREIGRSADGRAVALADIWPSASAIDAAVRQAGNPENTLSAYGDRTGPAPWADIPVRTGERFDWDPASAYIRRPPFVRRSSPAWPRGTQGLAVIGAYGDDVTTDAISPAGAVPPASQAGHYLRDLGVSERDLNVYAAFRGNFEVMRRGAFTAPALKNLLAPDAMPGMTRLSTEEAPVTLEEAASRSAGQGRMPVLLAGDRYGQGSSRDWAAKAPALIGIRAILATGFERIHRSNLIGMGIVPIELPEDWHPQRRRMQPGDTIAATFPDRPGVHAPVSLKHMRAGECLATGTGRLACHTSLEAELLASGGVFPRTINRLLGESAGTTSQRATA